MMLIDVHIYWLILPHQCLVIRLNNDSPGTGLNSSHSSACRRSWAPERKKGLDDKKQRCKCLIFFIVFPVLLFSLPLSSPPLLITAHLTNRLEGSMDLQQWWTMPVPKHTVELLRLPASRVPLYMSTCHQWLSDSTIYVYCILMNLMNTSEYLSHLITSYEYILWCSMMRYLDDLSPQTTNHSAPASLARSVPLIEARCAAWALRAARSWALRRWAWPKGVASLGLHFLLPDPSWSILIHPGPWNLDFWTWGILGLDIGGLPLPTSWQKDLLAQGPRAWQALESPAHQGFLRCSAAHRP